MKLFNHMIESSYDNLLYRYKELEKHTHEIEYQNNMLRSELNQKAEILSQVTKELSQIQMEYKQAVDNIVELSSMRKEKNFNNFDNIQNEQMKGQVPFIESLHNHGWSSEYQNRLNKYNHYKQYDYENFREFQNYPKEINDKLENKIMYYSERINQLNKEMKRWKNFAIRVFDISSEALGLEPEFPNHESHMQRQITVELVEQLAKKKADDSEIQRKYQLLQNRYNSLSQYLNKVKYQCNVLTEKAQSFFNNNPSERIGEISLIEEIVKQDNYYKEPISLRDNSNKKRLLHINGNEFDSDDEFLNVRKKQRKSSSNNNPVQSNHGSSSFSSFDNSFESIKNLVKSFSRQYPKEDYQSNVLKKSSKRKGTKFSSNTDFSFESHETDVSDFN